jgi:hypothetical protein
MTFVVLDHLVVAAATLQAGVAWCEQTLGVTPGPGGRHALMGTHNRLLKVATPAYPQAYLEILAIDPEAPPPGRPRWFGLDALDLSAGPRLIHWIGRSPMLDMHRWGLITVGCKPGDPIDFTRDTAQGPLQWQLLVREDGALEHQGALPSLIQWKGAHPTDAMPDSGLTLKAFAAHGVPPRAREVLRLRGVGALPAPPALQATFTTPLGEVVLNA